MFCASVNILTALPTHLWPARAPYSFPANRAPPTRLRLIVSNPDLSPATAPAATPVVSTQSLLSSTHTEKQIKGWMISSRGKTKRCFTTGMQSSRLRAKQYPTLYPSRDKSQHLRLELPHCQHGRHHLVNEFHVQPSYQNRRMSGTERSTKRRIIAVIRRLAKTSRLLFL